MISFFNDPETVLDVPRRAPQQEVYDRHYPNPDYLLPTGQLVTIVLEPEYRDGVQR